MTKKRTENYVDYAKTFFKTFDEEEFNEIDSTIFSWISYLMIHEDISNSFSDEGMPISELMHAEYYDELFREVYYVDKTCELLYAVIANPRYRNARIKYYRYESSVDISLQFCASVISFSKDFHYIAFRGTDLTVHGWKEDFMLAMSSAPPSKLMAINYINSVGEKLPGRLIVGGHSKGGHLAVYAAAHCNKDIQDRIVNVYSHDGPGFIESELNYPGMTDIRNRIIKTIPSASVVGIIFENETVPKYIKSTNKGALQHSPFSWVTDGLVFKPQKKQEGFSSNLISNINNLVKSMNDEDILLFTDDFFEIFESSGVDDINEILSNPKKYITSYIKTLKHLDPEKKKRLEHFFIGSLTGVSHNSETGEQIYNNDGIDWDYVETLANDLSAKEFGKKFNLFLGHNDISKLSD